MTMPQKLTMVLVEINKFVEENNFTKNNYAYVYLGVLYSMCLSYYSFINEIKDIFAFRFDKTTISLCVVSSWQKRGQLIW